MVVFGAGTIGLLVSAMAKLAGASVVIVDIDTGRVTYALLKGFASKGVVVSEYGDSYLPTEKLAIAKDVSDRVMQVALTGQMDIEGADVTFDCTGKEICMQAGLHVRPIHLKHSEDRG